VLYLHHVFSKCSFILSHICHATCFLCCFYKYCPWFFKFGINYGSGIFFPNIPKSKNPSSRALKKSKNKIFISCGCLKIFKKKGFPERTDSPGCPQLLCSVFFKKKHNIPSSENKIKINLEYRYKGRSFRKARARPFLSY